MRLLILVDTYVPARISGALQMRDLCVEMARMGHRPAVVVPSPTLASPWVLEQLDGVDVLRVRAPRTKDVNLVRRALAECMLPWFLLRGLARSPLRSEVWRGVVWYSPTIFLGIAARAIKRRHECRGYLIVRDLFPDWAVDAGVLKKGIIYKFFKHIEALQYQVADVIGVQTPANVPLVARDAKGRSIVEVLHNWLTPLPVSEPGIEMPESLRGRTIFVYAGNMGVAQEIDAFIRLAGSLTMRKDLGFLFVGRGSEVPRLRKMVRQESFDNIEILDEISPEQIPSLLRQCQVGIVALDPRHTTHNIPGKFISYLQAGLPVLARVNQGNDLLNIIRDEKVGIGVGASLEDLRAAVDLLASDFALRESMGAAGRRLAQEMFSPSSAASQVLSGIVGSRSPARDHALPRVDP